MPELGGDIPLETCLAQSREAGFCGTELGGKFPRDAAVLSPLLQKHNLQLASGWFSGLLLHSDVETELKRMHAQLETFAKLQTNILFYAETTGSVQGDINAPLSSRPTIADDAFAPYGEKLTALASRILTDYGIAIAYHHHMGTVIETDRDIDLLMQHTGEEVGLLADSGHIAFAGGEPADLLRRHHKRIKYIHCKDLRQQQLAEVRASDSSFMQAVLAGVFTVPGDGFLDFDAFLSAAAAISYSGWLVVEAEQDPAKANPLEYSRRGGQHLRECCERVGIEIVEK